MCIRDRVKQYTLGLAQEIFAGKREQVKFVIIGLGDNINELAMDELDAMTSQTNINLWDHMLVRDFQEVLKLFGEIIRDTRIVAKKGTVYDAGGNVLRNLPLG